MPHRMTRREFELAADAGPLASLRLGWPVRVGDGKTLSFIRRSDLRVLDAIWATAYVTRNYGYMVFDKLFALDFRDHRPGPLHGGTSRRSEDHVASLLTISSNRRNGMAHGMTRRELAATAAGLAALGYGARAEGAGTKTLRLIASSDLRVLDPIWTPGPNWVKVRRLKIVEFV